tara:strand:+ start:666 stop:1766 length:1101 start_codon:yes stop_codon:yes gene_type:complete
MIRYNLSFLSIVFLSLTALLIQYFFLNGFYDENNFLFSYYGDDYNYINNFKNLKYSDIKLSGLAKEGVITPYNALLFFIINFGGIYFYFFVEFLLFVLSNYCFYKTSQTFLNIKYRNWALIFYLILPLRYIWLFSFYKDSLILSLSIIFVYVFYFKKDKLLSLLTFPMLFLLRPIFSLIFLLGKLNFKYFFRFIYIFIPIFILSFYLLSDYLYFFRDERILVVYEKLQEFPLNESGVLNPILPFFLWIITLIQPLYRSTDSLLIWSSINTVVKFDALIKLALITPICHGLLFFRNHLKQPNFSIVFKLLCSLSLAILLGFLFLTNRHFIIFLPWQILFALYMINKNGFNLMYKTGFLILLIFIFLN